MFKFDRKTFFDSYRKGFGSIGQLQVDGLEFLLDKIEADREWESLPQIAYFLATIKHETGITRNKKDLTYQPIKELRAKSGTRVRKLQDRYWGSDYYGRGYIQITWRENYEKFGLASVPDDALQPNTAYMVAAEGMRRGMFTNYKLSDFVNGDVDYVNARQVVNRLDEANQIAEIAEKFERILKTSLVTESATETDTEPEQDDKPMASESIAAIPPLPVNVPSWARKIVGWGAGLNAGGLGASFLTLRDNPDALMAVLNLLKWGFVALVVVAGLIVVGVFIQGMYNKKLANDLNVARLKNFADPNTNNVDFSGWKDAPTKTEVKL